MVARNAAYRYTCNSPQIYQAILDTSRFGAVRGLPHLSQTKEKKKKKKKNCRAFDPVCAPRFEVAPAGESCTHPPLSAGCWRAVSPMRLARRGLSDKRAILPYVPTTVTRRRARAPLADAARLRSGCAHFSRRATRMKRAGGPARLHRVVSGQQSLRANPLRCWNCVRVANQRRRG